MRWGVGGKILEGEVSGGAVPSGYYIPEEVLLEHIDEFFVEGREDERFERERVYKVG
jgi:hypothetical protein